MRPAIVLIPLLLAACAAPGPGSAPAATSGTAPSAVAVPPDPAPLAGSGMDLVCDDGLRRRVQVERDAAGALGVRMDLDGQPRLLHRVTPPHLPAGLLLFEDVQAGWRWSVNQRVSVLVRHGGKAFVRIVARCTSAQPLQLP